MPRKARIDAPGALHHIIFREIERKALFRDLQDYEALLERFGAILSDSATTCVAWTLLPNHAHLLVRTGRVPLSTVMRRLLTGYAQYFNRRHRRAGHLFQNRYKSVLCEEDPYLLELVRYIHLNPLRARLVPDIRALEDFPWSGHRALMGKTAFPWQDVAAVLALFHDKPSLARRAYRSFVEEGIARGRRPELTGGGLVRSVGGWSSQKGPSFSDERILGSSDFVDAVLKQTNEGYDQTLAAAQGLTLDRLTTLVADHFHVDSAWSPLKERTCAQARALVCYLAGDLLKTSGVEIARHLRLTISAVSKLASKGRIDPLAHEIKNVLLGFDERGGKE